MMMRLRFTVAHGLMLATMAVAMMAACRTLPDAAPPAREAEPAQPGLQGSDDRPGFNTVGWKTDLARHGVPLSEITSGGPGKDGIPPIDRPKFLPSEPKVEWLKDNEPVIALVVAAEARAYPLQILIWHEIVNDVVGGTPALVTFCPLCNTAIAFDRRLDGTTHDFGTTGNLRHSDLVMYDRQTESFWQQITGEGIVGELTGKQLAMLPASIMSYKQFRIAYPKGKVLSRDTGFPRSYGNNPYTGYDDVNSSPFLFRGPADGRLRPMERVVTVSLGGQDVAYPYKLLEQRRVINHRAGGEDLVVFWAPGTASALDRSSIADSRDIGAAAVYRAAVDGRKLTFEATDDGIFTDRETGTVWNLAGQGLHGPLAGRALDPVVHANHFWFAWAVFRPQTEIYKG